jgi:hypothetical protein
VLRAQCDRHVRLLFRRARFAEKLHEHCGVGRRDRLAEEVRALGGIGRRRPSPFHGPIRITEIPNSVR